MSGGGRQRELCPALSPFNKHKCTKAPVWGCVRASRYVRACGSTADTHAVLALRCAGARVHRIHGEQCKSAAASLLHRIGWNIKFCLLTPSLLSTQLVGRAARSSSELPPAPVEHRSAAARGHLPLRGYPGSPHSQSLVWAYTSTPGSQQCSFFCLGRGQRQPKVLKRVQKQTLPTETFGSDTTALFGGHVFYQDH